MALHAEAAQSRSADRAVLQRPVPSPRTAPRREPTQDRAGSLASLVASEIIPRLLLAHAKAPAAVRQEPVRDHRMNVEAFTPLAVEGDAQGLIAHVERLLAEGVPVESMMVDLLAPAARLLGRWWEEDRCSFVEVTMGLWRLQEVVREVSRRVMPPPIAADGGQGRRALFATFPGEQHDFGALMVSELFHRHGWDCEALIGVAMLDLLGAAARRHYDLIGLTLSCDCHSARLPSAIVALRSVSRNPRVRVLVGGRVLNEDPSLAARAGADGTAGDGRGALILAERLVDALACGDASG